MRHLATPLAITALLASTAMAAAQQRAEVTADLNLRAGPGTRYPVVTTIPDGRNVSVYGCIDGYDWCDVTWGNTRGWVFSDYLDYRYRGRWRPVSEWGARVGLPVITFSFGDYSDRHYRGTRFFDRIIDWVGDDRDRDRDWDRDRDRDRDWDRDRGRDRDWDRDRGRDRDWDRDRDRDRRDRDGDRNRDDDGDRSQGRGGDTGSNNQTGNGFSQQNDDSQASGNDRGGFVERLQN